MTVMRMLSAQIPLVVFLVVATLDTLETEPFAVSLMKLYSGIFCIYGLVRF